jgi:hypothetical protein
MLCRVVSGCLWAGAAGWITCAAAGMYYTGMCVVVLASFRVVLVVVRGMVYRAGCRGACAHKLHPGVWGIT